MAIALRRYIPGLGRRALVQGDEIETDTIEAGDIAAGAVDTSELADGSLAASAAGRLKMADGFFNAATVLTKFAAGAVSPSVLSAVGSLFDGAAAAVTVITRNFVDGTPQELLAANGAGGGSRLLLVQAHVATALNLTSYDWDVGSASDPNGLFDDLFGGLNVGLRESEWSAYWLPEAEALQLLEIEQTDGAAPAGDVTFRILDLGAVVNSRVADDAINTDQIVDAAVTAAKLNADVVATVADVQLTNAQVLNLRAAPQTIIAAPAAGRAHVVIRVAVKSDSAAGAWTEPDANNLALEYSGGADILVVEATGLITTGDVQYRTQAPAVAEFTPVPAQAVQLLNNGAAEIAGGNAANTLRVQVAYFTISV